MKPVLAVILGLIVVGSLSGPARAQMESREGIALQNQILELRRDLQMLQYQGGGAGQGGRSSLGGYRDRDYPPRAPGGEGSAEMLPQLLDRISTLEEQVRQLRGQLDEVSNQAQRQGAQLGKRLDDLEFRLSGSGGTAPAAAEAAPTALAPQGAAPATSPAPATLGTIPDPGARVQPPRTPETALQQGEAALARRDYAAAEAAAREVLGKGRSPRSTDAQLLLANALAGQRDYQRAALAYDDAYNRSKTGPRAQEALIGLATALSNVSGARQAACATLGKLKSEFTTLHASVRDTAAALRQKNSCR